MNQQETQANPNQAAASLAFATQLSEQMMPKAPMQDGTASQESQDAPGQEQTPKTDNPEDGRIAELELSITKKLDDIRQELKGDAKAQIDSLKKDIELALQDEQA